MPARPLLLWLSLLPAAALQGAAALRASSVPDGANATPDGAAGPAPEGGTAPAPGAQAPRPAGGPGTPSDEELRRLYGILAPRPGARAPTRSGHILYLRYESERVAQAGLNEPLVVPRIFIMTGDGEGQAPFIAAGKLSRAENPWWFADGKRVAFASDFEMARSALFMDVFVADLETGLVRRVTGREWSAGPVMGTGTIFGVVRLAGVRLTSPSQVGIAVQGGGGVIHRLRGGRPGRDGREVSGEYYFVAEGVPAGKVWVKCWASKHAGALQFADVPAGGEARVETMDLSAGNFLATHPSFTPDGRYLVGLSQHPYYSATEPTPECGFDTIALLDTLRPQAPPVLWDPTRMQGQLAKQPQVSHDGKWIAFAMGDVGRESIAVCSLESMLRGAPEVRVVVPGGLVLGSHGVGNVSPAWSWDGRQLAFVRYTMSTQGFAGDLYVVEAGGTGLRQVTQLAANQSAATPSWAPDGGRLALQVVTSRRPVLDVTDILTYNVTSDIWTIGAGGEAPRQLTRDGRSAEPAWGP